MKAQGFTFIELMITLALIALLALIAIPSAQIVVQRKQEHELRAALIDIREALDSYRRAVESGHIPKKATESPYPPSLKVLVEGVPDQRSAGKKMLYFLRRMPRDPMHPDRTTPAADTWGTRSYQSPPDAPVAGEDVFDIYSRSEKVGLDGVPYREW